MNLKGKIKQHEMEAASAKTCQSNPHALTNAKEYFRLDHTSRLRSCLGRRYLAVSSLGIDLRPMPLPGPVYTPHARKQQEASTREGSRQRKASRK